MPPQTDSHPDAPETAGQRQLPLPIEIARVIVRDVSPRFDRCERDDPSLIVDVEAARREHRLYVATLAALTGENNIITLEAEADTPDCVFVEDTVVVIDHSCAVITRPGAPSRRPETAAMAAVLDHTLKMQLHIMAAPATLDGGDVLRVGDTLYVGTSRRTNPAGVAFLAGVAAPFGLRVQPMEVTRGLHLKSACSLADESTVLYDPQAGLDIGPLQRAGLCCLPIAEPHGANVLAMGAGAVIVSAACPDTAALLQRRGFTVHTVDDGEARKADGARTCCSVRIPAPGAWVT